MGFYKTICYSVEDSFIKMMTRKKDPALVREKVLTYRSEKENKKALKKSIVIKKEKVVSQPTKQSNDELINCILKNHTDGVIRCLETRQLGVYSKAKSGESALELAIHKDNKYMVAYLIKYGV